MFNNFAPAFTFTYYTAYPICFCKFAARDTDLF